MSIPIQRLALSTGAYALDDLFIVNQGSPPITRLATRQQILLATATSTGQVGTAPSPQEKTKISSLPRASQVYVNDFLFADQGTPPITRQVPVSIILTGTDTSTPVNTELVAPPPTNKSINQIPLAVASYLSDWYAVNQIGSNGSQTTRRTQRITIPPPPPPPPPPSAPNVFAAVASNGVLGNGQFAATSPDGITWTLRNSITTYDGAWRDVKYGNGLFVAAGQNNDIYQGNPGLLAQIMSSPDGVIWTRRISPAPNDRWTCLAYGNNIWVMLGVGNGSGGTDITRAISSPDGITWTARTAAVNNDWRAVCFGNGLFVAVSNSGVGNRVMTSPDGITWTSRTSAADSTWLGVVYAASLGLFVAVADTGTNRVMTSPDGINWTVRTAAEANTWIDITWNGTTLVAVAATGTHQVMTSTDGINWTAQTAAAANVWQGVAWNGTLFVTVSSTGTGNRAMTSPDGVTWTSRTSAADISWSAITWGGTTP